MTKNPKGTNQVTQNRDDIADIEHRLVDGLITQEHLVDEIQALQTGTATIRKGIIALTVALVLSIIATGVSFQAATNARKASEQVEVVQDAATVRILDICRTRNAAPKAVRDSLTAAYDTLEALVEPENIRDIYRLREAIPPASLTDVDCNGNGVLDAMDYQF
jgi:hypothetical protein